LRKALAIDLDGTLLSSSKEIGAETLSTIRKLADQGYLVIVSTARPVRAVKLL
jgi:hydroxymethylpyrimidine pyrophosphatase-like HAD family hydrolase